MSAPGNIRKALSSRSDWETPWPVFEALDREFRFTVDAAASPENRKCERYLTEEEDALTADMIDQTVFCNPPYGPGWKACTQACARKACLRRGLHISEDVPGIGEWIKAFKAWAASGSTVVALLPANTETEWFRSIFASANELRLVYPRINFVGTEDSGNTGGSIIAVWRPCAVTPVCVVSSWTWKGG